MIGGLPENSFTDSIVFGLYNIAFSFVVFFIMLNFIIAIIVEVLTLLAVLLQKYSCTGTKVHILTHQALPDLTSKLCKWCNKTPPRISRRCFLALLV